MATIKLPPIPRNTNNINEPIDVVLPGYEVVTRLDQLNDVDVLSIAKEDKSLLAFDLATALWKHTKTLDDHVIYGGDY